MLGFKSDYYRLRNLFLRSFERIEGSHELPGGRSNDEHRRELAVTVIKPLSGWRLVNWNELCEYRDLFWFLTLRNVRVLYAQSAAGIGWAVIQPLFSMIVFTIVFGNLAQVSSDGVPYAVFSFTGLVPWTYFANALTEGTSSLVQNANMVTKVYFPRLILPLAAVAAKLVDFSIAMLMLFMLMIWYGILPTGGVVALPMLVVLMIVTSAGLGAWLTAMAIQYRDVKHGMSFAVQLLMYAAPVVYPASLIPEEYRLLYCINPMVGVIEGFRAVLLNTQPMPWSAIAIGAASALVTAFSGVLYFQRKERIFADVA